MQAIDTYKVDKSGFPAGPWHYEADKYEWRSEGTPRLPCLIVRNSRGALCGYVGVPPGHPYHGADGFAGEPSELEVHGGVTFGGMCAANGSICHRPLPGETDDVWWIGFDCMHYMDFAPGRRLDRGANYKDVDFVKSEVDNLARQCQRAAKGLPPNESEASPSVERHGAVGALRRLMKQAEGTEK